MTTTSIPKAEERSRCFRHEGHECPRCDGSGFRPRPVCAGCGESARTLSPARTAKSPEEARALPRYCPRCNPRRRGIAAALAALEGMGGLMAPRPVAAVEVHHQIPRNLLGFWDRGQGPGLEAEDLQAWLDWEAEAFRYGVDPDASRDELAALIEGSTVELPREKHRAIHAQQWAEWGSLGGTETLRRYGTAWFSLLARRRWEQVGAEVPAEVFGVLARGGRG